MPFSHALHNVMKFFTHQAETSDESSCKEAPKSMTMSELENEHEDGAHKVKRKHGTKRKSKRHQKKHAKKPRSKRSRDPHSRTPANAKAKGKSEAAKTNTKKSKSNSKNEKSPAPKTSTDEKRAKEIKKVASNSEPKDVWEVSGIKEETRKSSTTTQEGKTATKSTDTQEKLKKLEHSDEQEPEGKQFARPEKAKIVNATDPNYETMRGLNNEEAFDQKGAPNDAADKKQDSGEEYECVGDDAIKAAKMRSVRVTAEVQRSILVPMTLRYSGTFLSQSTSASRTPLGPSCTQA